MRAAVWTRTLITFLLWGLCLPVYSMFYVVIMKTHNSGDKLEEILSQPLLEQEWQQLILSPLAEGSENTLFDQLTVLLPNITFEPERKVQDKRFFTGKDPADKNAFYIIWLISYHSEQVESPDTIKGIYARLLPDKPVTAVLQMTPVKSLRQPSAFPFQSTLIVVKPNSGSVCFYNLFQQPVGHSCNYYLTQSRYKGSSQSSQAASLNKRFLELTQKVETLGFAHTSDTSRSPSQLILPSATQGQPTVTARRSTLSLPTYHSEVTTSEVKFLTPEKLVTAGTKRNEEILQWTPQEIFKDGHYGNVRLYFPPTPEQTPLVIKKIATSGQTYSYLSREVSYLHTLRHENIIGFNGIAINKPKLGLQELWVALEYMPARDVGFQIGNNPDLFTERNIQIILRGVISAVRYLHELDSAHRDLKPDNVLLQIDQNIVIQVKVSDFGFTTYAGPASINVIPCGSPFYAPPERIRNDFNPCLKKGDMWGIGAILNATITKSTQPYPAYKGAPQKVWEFINWRKQHPEEEIGEKKAISRLIKPTTHFQTSQAAIDFIQQLCHSDLQQRPDIRDAHINPFLSITPTKVGKQ